MKAVYQDGALKNTVVHYGAFFLYRVYTLLMLVLL